MSGALLDLIAIAPGIILPTASDLQADPPGWMFCDGRQLNIADQPALYGAIGNKWNTTGDGITTFNIPHASGRGFIFVGQGAGLTERLLGDTGGAESHEITESEMPAHRHFTAADANSSSTNVPVTAGKSMTKKNNAGNDNSYELIGVTTEPTVNRTSEVGDGDPVDLMNPFLALNALIKL